MRYLKRHAILLAIDREFTKIRIKMLLLAGTFPSVGLLFLFFFGEIRKPRILTGKFNGSMTTRKPLLMPN